MSNNGCANVLPLKNLQIITENFSAEVSNFHFKTIISADCCNYTPRISDQPIAKFLSFFVIH